MDNKLNGYMIVNLDLYINSEFLLVLLFLKRKYWFGGSYCFVLFIKVKFVGFEGGVNFLGKNFFD